MNSNVKVKWLDLKNVDVISDSTFIFKNLTLELFLNENTVILGPNGSGKTNLIKIINRDFYPVVKKNSYISILGQKNINIWNLRSQIGFITKELEQRIPSNSHPLEIFQDSLEGRFSSISRKRLTKNEKLNIEETIETFELNNLIYIPYSKLSEGQKKLIMIARATIIKPKILILDEPCTNLDPKSSYKVMKMISKISKRNTTLLHITHRVDTITKETSRIIFLKKGKVAGEGNPQELLTSKNLSKLYNHNLKVINENRNWQLISID